jgi:hypothetical protein
LHGASSGVSKTTSAATNTDEKSTGAFDFMGPVFPEQPSQRTLQNKIFPAICLVNGKAYVIKVSRPPPIRNWTIVSPESGIDAALRKSKQNQV